LGFKKNINTNRTSNFFGSDHWIGIEDGTNLHTYFEGMIGDIKIYNRALSHYEINALLLV
jgi:hypothetical protein